MVRGVFCRDSPTTNIYFQGLPPSPTASNPPTRLPVYPSDSTPQPPFQALLARAKEEEARLKLEQQRAMRRRVTDALAVVQTDDRLSYCRQLLREASSACVLDAITGNLVHVQVRAVRFK